MSRGTWNISVKSGGIWGADSTIYRPNGALTIGTASTQTKGSLADGNDVHITPSIKYKRDPLTFIWYYDNGTIKAQVEGYIESQNDLRITDHNSTIYYGRFTNILVNWGTGEDSNKYDIQATYERMPSLA